jgi:hypothetical protein
MKATLTNLKTSYLTSLLLDNFNSTALQLNRK